MQSSNPVFSRSEAFAGRNQEAYGYQTYPGSGPYAGYGQPPYPQQAGYADPATWQTGQPTTEARITVDDVVAKTALTLGVLIMAAAATWIVLPEIPPRMVTPTVLGAAFIGLGLGLVNSFKRVVSPALVIAYAVVEGVFVGAMSKIFNTVFDGVVVGAVLGTVAAFAGTLAAYKFFDIQVSARFRKFVVAAMFGFVALSLLDFMLHFFGAGFGFNGFGTMGLISSVVGLAIGVLMLILDFDYVENAVAAGAPERESWRAAFGLTVTIVWIYIELMRILAILRSE
jgi:uncharacterized YccA/Bax inhibitor family protein